MSEYTFEATISDKDTIKALKELKKELEFYKFMEEMFLYYDFLDIMKNANMIWT